VVPTIEVTEKAMRKAFTLIELLVVIAIIAILAAILFPVFTQAKESAKKTQTLSNVKNMGLGAIIYIGDADDNYPLGYSFDTTARTWRYNFIIRTPAGWTGGPQNTEPRKSEDGLFWSNAIYSYMKSWDIYSVAGAPNTTVVTATPVVKPANIGFAYNGLLHAYSSTAAASPATLPLFWGGNGKQNMIGFGSSNPGLLCNVAGTEACRYTPGAHPQTGVAGQGGTMYFINGCNVGVTNGPTHKAHGDDTVWMYADGHAKVKKIGMQASPANTDGFNDPNTGYYAGGKCAQSYWWDGSHPWLFRPDYQP
jgi:prepilin-type N-terminal cleavage/methylation domain-containing protein